MFLLRIITDLQNIFKFGLLITHTRIKLLIKKKMGVTQVFFELNKLKRKLAAILKRLCCHSNYSYTLFRHNFWFSKCCSISNISFHSSNKLTTTLTGGCQLTIQLGWKGSTLFWCLIFKTNVCIRAKGQ